MLTAAQEASPVAEVGFLTAVASFAAERRLGAGVSSCSAQGPLTVSCVLITSPQFKSFLRFATLCLEFRKG